MTLIEAVLVGRRALIIPLRYAEVFTENLRFFLIFKNLLVDLRAECGKIILPLCKENNYDSK